LVCLFLLQANIDKFIELVFLNRSKAKTKINNYFVYYNPSTHSLSGKFPLNKILEEPFSSMSL